jgi:hypothetical protein
VDVAVGGEVSAFCLRGDDLAGLPRGDGDYGLAMLAWVAAALVLRRKWSGWMLSGVGLSAVAGWVQQSGWGLSPGFNHNDVFHVIQALALVGFYRAGSGLGER